MPLQEPMVFQCLHLCLRQDRQKLIAWYLPHAVEAPRSGEELFASLRSDAGELFEDVFLHGGRPTLPSVRDRESMRFVADFLQSHELRTPFLEKDRLRLSRDENLLFALREGSEIRSGRDVAHAFILSLLVDHLYRFSGARELTLSTVDEDERRPWSARNSFLRTAHDDLTDGAVVVDLPFFQSLDLVFTIAVGCRLSIDEDTARGDGMHTRRMRYVVAFE